jgi:SPP1 family predicted phage head-tail adaptor
MARLGKMRHRVEIQTEALTADGGGGGASTWTTVATVWAEVKPLSGSEGLRAMQLTNPVSHEIRMRQRTIPSGARLLHRDRVLNIVQAINVDEGDRYLKIMARENVAQ